MAFRVWGLLFIIISFSCQNRKYPAKLCGLWVLDSTSGKGGIIIPGGPRGHTEFILRKDNSFEYRWSDSDVFGSFKGTYNYHYKKMKLMPLLIFSIRSGDGKGSIVRKDTLSILSLTDSLMRTQETERYTVLDSILVVQKRINIYRKY